MSRAQLARETGLDPKTMTNLCSELLKEGLVFSEPAPANGRGRPGELLHLNADAAFSLGVDVGPCHVTAALIDFKGIVREQWQQNFDVAQDADILLKTMHDAIHHMLNKFADLKSAQLKGICLCTPGLINRKDGLVLQTVNIPGFNNLNVFQQFSHLKLPVFLEEASHCQAIAEKWFGGYYHDQNFITMDIGYGIGMGIMFNGVLYRGANEKSGEIGHTVVAPDGITCSCGKKGCLETVAGGRALEKTAQTLPLAKYSITTLGAKAIHEAAQQGDRQAIDILAQSGAYIGMAISNAINLFDPGTVILHGGLVRAGDYLLQSLKQSIHEHAISDKGSSVQIKTSTLGHAAGARGAAMVPFENCFEFDKIEL